MMRRFLRISSHLVKVLQICALREVLNSLQMDWRQYSESFGSIQMGLSLLLIYVRKRMAF